MTVYMHPSSFRPPLAFGGHEWLVNGNVASCWGCGVCLPLWAVVEGIWMTFTDRWCPNKVAALGTGKRRPRRAKPVVSTELDGQLSIYDVLGDPA